LVNTQNTPSHHAFIQLKTHKFTVSNIWFEYMGHMDDDRIPSQAKHDVKGE